MSGVPSPWERMIHLVRQRPASRSPVLPFSARPLGVAVLLNARAKAVNAQVRRTLSELVPHGGPLPLARPGGSREIADWRGRPCATTPSSPAAATAPSSAGSTGSSTAAERRAPPAPRFGVLALGTGNAVAEIVGATPATTPWTWTRSPRARVRATRLDAPHLRRAPDAVRGRRRRRRLLNDYRWMKDRLAGGPAGARPRGHRLRAGQSRCGRRRGSSGSAAPPTARSSTPGARRTGSTAGAPRRPGHRPGELLYAGPCAIAGASTVPFYGMGLRAFPFAGRRAGAMSLRVFTRVPVPSLWS